MIMAGYLDAVRAKYESGHPSRAPARWALNGPRSAEPIGAGSIR